MISETKITPTPESTSSTPHVKPALNINLDYLVPTLSAICAGFIHHICNKKEALTYVDALLIISPSLPVLLGLVIKIIAFMINWIANGTQNMNLGFLGTIIQKVNGWMNVKQKVDNTHSFDEQGRLIFHKYTVNIDISKKITEWQQKGYKINYLKENYNFSIQRIVEYFTKINHENPNGYLHFKNFYHEFTLNNENIIVYFDNGDNGVIGKYSSYIVSLSKHYTVDAIRFRLYPTEYEENTSYYRISRIYNEYRDELFHTIKMYKEKSTNKRKVCMNFCFAGPPGTSKTYGARAIAKELSREIFEINLSKIVYEEDFLELFSEENIKKYVFLLDEIDLMCPSRDFDDKLIKSAEESRLSTLGIVNTNTNAVIDYDSEHSSLTEEDGFVNKKLLHQISLLQDEVRKLHEKMDKTSSFQEWLKDYLMRFAQVTLELLYFMFVKNVFSIGFGEIMEKTKLRCLKSYNGQCYDKDRSFKPLFIDEKMESVFDNNSSSNDSSTSNNSSPKTPFTLRTLLNFISGGNTHDDLVMIATTNRHEKLDPALIRPGRLRLIEFKNLRKEDAISMLLENYPEERNAIERGLDKIGYTDYMSNGALLEAIMSSTHTLEKTLKTFQRELCNLSLVH